jgi:hypothetical protein
MVSNNSVNHVWQEVNGLFKISLPQKKFLYGVLWYADLPPHPDTSYPA